MCAIAFAITLILLYSIDLVLSFVALCDQTKKRSASGGLSRRCGPLACAIRAGLNAAKTVKRSP
jgi:hypothetical protein